MTGSGKAVVLAVGKRTLREKEIKGEITIGDEETPMQHKLADFGDLLSKYAYLAAFLIFCILTFYQFIQIIFGAAELVSIAELSQLINNLQITIAILIVCVPEGLPLAVTMAMAFSVDKLINENLLIKNLEALEISGSILDIMTGKTATLTKGEMKVEKLWAGQSIHYVDSLELNIELSLFIQQAIILNTDARMEMNDEEHTYVPKGSGVEIALLNFLISNNFPVQDQLVSRERN